MFFFIFRHQGLIDIKEAIDNFSYDSSVVKDGCLALLKIVELYPALVTVVFELTNELLMSLLQTHNEELQVVDAISSLLAVLPLEDGNVTLDEPVARKVAIGTLKGF